MNGKIIEKNFCNCIIILLTQISTHMCLFQQPVMQCFRRTHRIICTEIPLKYMGLPSTKSSNNVQTVIIGAGLAGLSAAHHLITHGFTSTIVVEASARFGGRIDSKQFGDTFCELGAKWVIIDTNRNSVYDLLRQTYTLQKRIQQKQVIEYRNTHGQSVKRYLPDSVNIYFRKLCNNINLQELFSKGVLCELNNVKDFLHAETDKITKTMFKENDQALVHDIFVTLMKEYSGKLGCNLEYLNVEQLFKFKDQYTYSIYVPSGLSNIFDEIIKVISKENLQTGKPVGEIRWLAMDRDAIEKNIVNCLDGSVLTADHIICTLPLGVLKTFSKCMFKPPLPSEKTKAIKNLGYGCPVKIYFEYKKLVKLWFKSNLRPLWCRAEQPSDLNWVHQVVEISTLPNSNRVLEITVGGGYYDDIEKMPDHVVISEVTELLRKCFNNKLIPYPQDMLRSNWSSSACFMGGRPYFSISSSVQDIQILAKPLGVKKPSLLFAGDATTLKGFGSLDGARLSGIREAQRIIEYYQNSNCQNSNIIS